MNINEYLIVKNDNGTLKLELSNRYKYPKNIEMGNVEDTVDMINKCCHLNKLTNEYLYLIGYDFYKKIIGIIQLSKGNEKCCDYNVNEMITSLFLMGAKYFRIVHNHPNGNKAPSYNDIQCLLSTRFCTNYLNVVCIGSVIIANEEFLVIDNILDGYFGKYDEEDYNEVPNPLYDDTNYVFPINIITLLLQNKYCMTEIEMSLVIDFIENIIKTRNQYKVFEKVV